MTKGVTRADIASAAAEHMGLQTQICRKVLDDVLTCMSDALVAGESVSIPHFGRFVLRHKEEREGRNPRTKEPAVIQARRTVLLHFSATARERVEEGGRARRVDPTVI